ncbi:MAG: VIT1/CCC1 transporter family protein [Planctomycetes bacterium]|nr:VIT1/CCC1 transporter family protein [Planctomycetota bacterium]
MSSTHERWHEERQAAWVYRAIASAEPDKTRSQLFLDLARAADEQADILAGDLRVERGGEAARTASSDEPPFRPELRARVVAAIARTVGPRRVQPMLAAIKVRGLSSYGAPAVDGHVMPVAVHDIGARHRRAGGGGTLRAAVFGINDGLVSNACLVLGVAGAEAEPRTILMTGVAGLLAGAFSMAAGEYISMRSQRELFEHQIAEERSELERYPEAEAEELALIYAARGVPIDDARVLTSRMVRDKERMLDTLAREELGLNPDDLGSPWGAAGSSFAAFAVGAVVPLAPFFWCPIDARLACSAALAGIALFAVGAVLALFSGRSAWFGGLRMCAIGASAGIATWGIGRWIGVGALP